MLRLLERAINTLDDRLVLLAPPGDIPASFQNVVTDGHYHARLVREMQALRGKVYLADGAVDKTQLTRDGLHQTAEDNISWHLLTLDERQRVTGCAWYLQHDDAVHAHQLRVRHCPLALMAAWRDKLWRCVESEIVRARRECIRYAEVGGWAVSERSRRTSEGMLLALAGYSLGRICGECLGITTATVRHCSASILRRLGGAPLSLDGMAMPSYYDPRYKCEMEILRFDSRRPNSKYASLVDVLHEKMVNVRVIAPPSHDLSLDESGCSLSYADRWAPSVPQMAFGS
jgi:hypothetical protein